MKQSGTISEKLSKYIVSTGYEDIPERVVKKAKQIILDSICCMIGGSQTQVGQICARTMIQLGGNPESTLIGHGTKICSTNAVFANSMMANVLDFDDTFPWAGHPGATVIPPALSMGEKMCANGKAILTAVILSYEICGRVGIAIRPSPEGLKKIWGYGTWQTFGATVAAGKLLGLTETEFSHALGIAGCNAPLPSLYKSALGESGNTMVKNNYGLASQVGVLSALLAHEGFEGPFDIFEGDRGFWRMAGSDQCKFEALTEKLHEDFKTEQIAFKPYPSVRWNHSAIDGVLKIVNDAKIKSGDVEEIEIRSFELVTHHPFNITEPKDPHEAAFSTPFDIAVAVAKIPPGPEWYMEKQLKDSQILKLAKKVHLIEDPEANELYPEKQLSKVKVKTKERSIETRVEYPKGELQNPMSQGELEDKFRNVSHSYMKGHKIEGILELIGRFEKLEDINKVTELLRVDK
jgi:2-methylcitrate dehydratase PrpD